MSSDSNLVKMLQNQSKDEKRRNYQDRQSQILPEEYAYLTNQDVTYESVGFNKFMERVVEESPFKIFSSTELIDQVERGSISSDKLGPISKENILQAINDLVKLADSASLSTSLSAGSRATLTSTLTDNQDPNRILLGVFHVTAYEGSIAANNEITFGSSITGSDWDSYTAHDWGSNNNRYTSAKHYVRNQSASTKTVLWDLHWRFIGGTAS